MRSRIPKSAHSLAIVDRITHPEGTPLPFGWDVEYSSRPRSGAPVVHGIGPGGEHRQYLPTGDGIWRVSPTPEQPALAPLHTALGEPIRGCTDDAIAAVAIAIALDLHAEAARSIALWEASATCALAPRVRTDLLEVPDWALALFAAPAPEPVLRAAW